MKYNFEWGTYARQVALLIFRPVSSNRLLNSSKTPEPRFQTKTIETVYHTSKVFKYDVGILPTHNGGTAYC